MKKSLKNRIISGLSAFALVLSCAVSSGLAFGEEENADRIAVVQEAGTESGTEADIASSDDSLTVQLSDQTGEGETVITGTTVDSSEDTVLTHQSFELYPDETDKDKMVTLDGLMPEDASAEVVDVTDQSTRENVVAAYDITITDGETEYQPGEEHPITVEISDSRIEGDANISLWHIRDDGVREEITDFTVEDGKVSFDAVGFSVYEIVNGPEPITLTAEYADTVEKLTSSDKAKDGFYLSVNLNNADKYITNTLNSDSAFIEVDSYLQANRWYFKKLENGNYNIYTYVGGEIKYLSYPSDKANNAALVSEDGADFTIELDGDTFRFLRVNGTRYLQHSNSGKGVRYHTDRNPNGRFKAVFASSVTIPDDQYGLNGKTYGLMYYSGGTAFGKAMMAKAKDSGKLLSQELVTKNNPYTFQENSLFVPKDSDMSMWTFHLEKEDEYRISVLSEGVEKYLKISGNSLLLAEESEASVFKVTPGSGNFAGKVMLSVGTKAIKFSSNTFQTGALSDTDGTVWLNLTKLSNFSEDDFVVYSAQKVGVSDTVNVKNGSQVIVYTRFWDDANKTYRFYAIDRDGSLVPCFERGDNIMWVGSQINTLLWEFTEYTYEDGTPNNYYELQNIYSEKYLAPQIGGGQVLSDSKIGINLPGRRQNQYYSAIIAWDTPYYSYAALDVNSTATNVISGSLKNAEDFYFAIMEAAEPTLTTVDTIDNAEYGIKMRMVDYKDNTSNSEQNTGLGDSTNWEAHKYEPKQGILSTNLITDPTDPDKKYPTTAAGKSLGELFEEATDVNHLFIESTYKATGYFEFDSTQNFATLIGENGAAGSDFTVYKELGTSNFENKNTLKHGQFLPYDTITPGVYSSANPENLYSALGDELPETDPRKYEKLHSVSNGVKPNYYNGMELEASFVQTPSGKDAWGHDIIFEFTGDDDFWLYVDDELVIDLGGIHSALGGSVNFCTGDVYVNGVKTDLRSIFENNYKARNASWTQEGLDAYLAEYFYGDEKIFRDYTSHTMKIFYMERGAGASNLHMRFNLSYVTPGSVVLSKEVTGSTNIDFDLVQYPFQIWYIDEEFEQENLLSYEDDNYGINVSYQNSTQTVDFAKKYTPPGGNTTYDNVFFLYPGKAVEIHFPSKAIRYKVIECGINTEVYDQVSVNGEVIQGTSISSGEVGRSSYDSGWISVEERPRVTYENHVDPDGLRSLTFQKKLLNESKQNLYEAGDPTTYDFRLYLSNGITDDLSLANMIDYYVKNPDGYLCYWDFDSQRFKSTVYQSIEDIYNQLGHTDAAEAEKTKVTQTSSMNGSISKIPPWYSVEVPNLTVGMKFKVEERFSEIAQGYGRIDYERVESSYIFDPDGPKNEGWVRANESPQMAVINQRGYGLEAQKIWSDKGYTKWHDTIYTAVYENGSDTPLPGSVRVLNYPDTYVRYYLEADMLVGKSLDNFSIYEVDVVTNEKPDEDGVIHNYTSVTRKLDGDVAKMWATAKNSTSPQEYDYRVTYEKGEPQMSFPELGYNNYRIDTITNTRQGGVAITLYDMNTKEPLANGKFTLKKYDSSTDTYVNVANYTSDASGRVTILYEFDVETEYILTETASPSGYIGLPNLVQFTVNADYSVTISGNTEEWQKTRTPEAGDLLTAYIDLYNKPFTIEVFKYDGSSNGNTALKQVYFSLYRGHSGLGGVVKDYVPMTGYEDLVTDDNGLIRGINHELAPNTYFLTEKTPQAGYQGLEGDVVFRISPLGEIVLVDSPAGSNVELVEQDSGTIYKYRLNIPNRKIDGENKVLTVTKTVSGNMGDKSRNFTFHFSVQGDEGSVGYAWKKNDEEMTEALVSGGTFTLGHNDKVEITVPEGAEVTIKEDSDGYDASFKLGAADAVEDDELTFEMSDDIILAVTNTKTMAVPTGVWVSFGSLLAIGAGLLLGIWFLCRRRRMTEAFLNSLRNRRM